MKVFIKLLSVMLVLSACSSQNKPVEGVYCTSPKNIFKTFIIEQKTGYKIRNGMWVLGAKLREDGSYILGSCDCQILESGKYLVQNDSIMFYDRLSMKTYEILPKNNFYFDENNSEFYFTYVDPDSNHKLVILELNNFEHHLGFFRNQNWSLDSINEFYEYWPLDKQTQWLDSILTVRDTSSFTIHP